jgi:hypothetical protein
VVDQGNLYALAAESNLYDRIVTAQHNDEDIQNIIQKLAQVYLFPEGSQGCDLVWKTPCGSFRSRN